MRVIDRPMMAPETQMMKKKSNIILIGMPGSGKSTVGVILAKMLAKRFLDTDILLQNLEKRSLQDIVDQEGHMALREVEQKVLLGIRCRNHIVATGGSAAYSEPAMTHLKKDGIVVFLHADLPALKQRIHNYETRGLAKRPDQSFQDLFEERLVLYERYADITVKSSTLTQDQVCDLIIDQLPKTTVPDLRSCRRVKKNQQIR
jgi:shikimate kinase